MLDNMSLDSLIEQQIKLAVEQRVQAILEQTDWIDQLENRIVKYAQDRIVARFANISTVPDLISTVQNSVTKLFNQGHIPGLENYVDKNKITQSIDNGIQDLVNTAIDTLVIDPAWQAKIEGSVNQLMSLRLGDQLSLIDLNGLIVSHIDSGIDRWQDRLKKDFSTIGIADQATARQLTVMDGIVVVESELVSDSVEVQKDIKVNGTVITKNLIVTGSINVDNHSWNELSDHISEKTLAKVTEEWRKNLVDEIVEISKKGGIDFSSVSINGELLIDGQKLSSKIKESNLETVGYLKELHVRGTTIMNNTMYVHNKRIGINTDTPEMALSVWDEEIALIAGKLSKQQAYVGTARLQNLAIGVNRVPQIEIDIDGLTTIKQLRVGRHRISHAVEVPGYSGTRGDIVFNSNPTPESPFAWTCLGSFQWKPLYSK
jgi:hypothetical protein